MNVVDSCGWLEYFADGKIANYFAPIIENTALLIVPTISLFEVFKRVLQQRDENDALALSAAKLSFELKLPIADSLILATARAHTAVLWTQDDDFARIQGVQYIQKYS